MPDTLPTKQRVYSFQVLVDKTKQAEDFFAHSNPELYNLIQTEGLLNSEINQEIRPSEPAPTPAQEFASQLTREEHTAVIQKAIALSQLPPSKGETETDLYLEQQLSEMLGFGITSELEGNQLPHTNGVIEALPHFKRSPTDSSSEHQYPHASFTNRRSFFGWFAYGAKNDQDEYDLAEKYALSLPLFLLPEWSLKSVFLKKWFAFRKVVLINPVEYTAVVCSVANLYPAVTAKYQFGGSPEVIIQAKCWSPNALGRSLLYFVQDSELPLGPVNLIYSEDNQ